MSLPQIAFSLIFPLAVLLVLAGWTAAVVAFVRRRVKGSPSAGRTTRRPYLPRRRKPASRDSWELVRAALHNPGDSLFPPTP